MRKLQMILVLILFSVVTLVPTQTAEAAQYYMRWAAGMRISCTQSGGNINVVLSNRAAQYSNPDNNPGAIFRVVTEVNDVTDSVGSNFSIPNGVGTANYMNFADTVASGYPMKYAYRFETYVGLTNPYISEMTYTCNSNISNQQMALTNRIPGATAYRRWTDDKTAVCSTISGSLVRVAFNNYNVDYSNPGGSADYVLRETDDGEEITRSGPFPVEFGSGVVLESPSPANSFTSSEFYPLDFSYIIHTYDENGLYIFRSRLRATCAGAGPAIVIVTDTVITASDRATVQSTLALQGRPAPPFSSWSIPVRVRLEVQDSQPDIADLTLITTDSGQITFGGQAPGFYFMYVKGTSTLQVRAPVTLTAGTNTITLPTLREGDADNNNVVNILDFSLLATAFGASAGNANYNANADFNRDGVVNILDFSLLATNFGQVGAS